MSTGSVQPFSPSVTITLAASSTAVGGVFAACDVVLVFNATAAIAFVLLGTGTATATATPVPAGARQLFATGPNVTAVSVVLVSGTGSVYVTAGLGTAY